MIALIQKEPVRAPFKGNALFFGFLTGFVDDIERARKGVQLFYCCLELFKCFSFGIFLMGFNRLFHEPPFQTSHNLRRTALHEAFSGPGEFSADCTSDFRDFRNLLLFQQLAGLAFAEEESCPRRWEKDSVKMAIIRRQAVINPAFRAVSMLRPETTHDRNMPREPRWRGLLQETLSGSPRLHLNRKAKIHCQWSDP